MDDAGNTDGIGSRYFSIQNTGRSSPRFQPPSQKSHVLKHKQEQFEFSQISDIPINYTDPVRIKKGYRSDTQPQVIDPDEKGITRIRLREIERIEIRLSSEAWDITGYMVVGNQLRPLPIGSTLDVKTSTFYWQPGPGFFGEYRLVFVTQGRNGEMSRKDILLKIVPKFLRLY